VKVRRTTLTWDCALAPKGFGDFLKIPLNIPPDSWEKEKSLFKKAQFDNMCPQRGEFSSFIQFEDIFQSGSVYRSIPLVSDVKWTSRKMSASE
uniref:Uncharacterized protein n=1 Tax=Scophthalmus maximus TaxID=52904 RepID=A0A8D3AGT9_SCOMX